MPLEPCPLLGTLDENYTPGPPVEYPSFENRCLVADERDTLLLADQATYCLSGGCRLCPRFRAADSMAANGRVDARAAADVAGGVLASDQLRPELMGMDGAGYAGATSRRWTWLGAGVIFITLVLCGAMFAAWSGWQQVQAYLDDRQAGLVQSVAAQAPALQYIVMTATSPAPVEANPVVAAAQVAAVPAGQAAQPVAQAVAQPAIGEPAIVNPSQVTQPGQVGFPAAVTPTSAPAGLPLTDASPTPPLLIVVDPALLNAEQTPPNILLEVPTRRATPIFDIPTSTPSAETPTNTPTQTPSPTPMGTPSVVFQPAQQAVPDGECTMISWAVQNVREVYYENLGVDGRGQHEECVDDTLEVYHLVVVLPDGSARTYTTTVTMLQPTSTPEPSPTFTPEPVFTATWTPLPPTPTNTPSVRWGVAVNVNGSTQQECAVGNTCDIGLVVSNTGDQIDTILVSIVQGSGWGAQLCRADGVCASSNLVLPSMGPGNSASINLRVAVQGDSAGQSQQYGVQASSTGSGGSATSGSTTVTIAAR